MLTPQQYSSIYTSCQDALSQLAILDSLDICRQEDSLAIADLSMALRYCHSGQSFTTRTGDGIRCDSTATASDIISRNLVHLYLIHRVLESTDAQTLADLDIPNTLCQETLNLYTQLSNPAAPSLGTTSLFSAPVAAASITPPVSTIPAGKATLSLTPDMELCLNFHSRFTRDDIFEELTRRTVIQNIEHTYRHGLPFCNNPSGQTPMTYRNNSTAIFFPTYDADSSHIACNFMCPIIRSVFLATLGLIEHSEEALFSEETLGNHSIHTYSDSNLHEIAHTRTIGSSSEPNICALFFKKSLFNSAIEIDMTTAPQGYFSVTRVGTNLSFTP